MPGITFKIDGEEYPFTGADDVTMDEAITLHDYSGLTLDQLEDLEGFNPKVIAAFMHIAVARKRTDLKSSDIRKLVGGVKVNDLADAFEEAEAKADALPPSVSGDASEPPPSSGASGPSDGDPSPELFAPKPSGSLA